MTQSDYTLKPKPLENETETLLESRQRRGTNGDVVVACSSKLLLVHRLLFCLSRKVTTQSSWQDKHSMELKRWSWRKVTTQRYAPIHVGAVKFARICCWRAWYVLSRSSSWSGDIFWPIRELDMIYIAKFNVWMTTSSHICYVYFIYMAFVFYHVRSCCRLL